MSKKIKINIPEFGERFCSDNVKYELFDNKCYYRFYKKGTGIRHNEYGPAIEWKDGSYLYFINDKYHRLNDYAFYNTIAELKLYSVIGILLGKTKDEFIQNLANTLIPKK